MKSFPSFLVPVSSISESYWLYLSNYVLRIHPLPLSLSADTSVNIISSLDFCCNFRNNLPASTPCSPPQLVPNMTTRSILLKLGQIISLLCSEASMGWFIIHKVKTKVILVSYRLYTVWFSLLLVTSFPVILYLAYSVTVALVSLLFFKHTRHVLLSRNFHFLFLLIQMFALSQDTMFLSLISFRSLLKTILLVLD